MLILTVSLKDNIDCNTLCKRLQESIQKNLRAEDIDRKIITVNLNDIVDSQQISGPRMIESK
ncbi:hypothetical protein EB169_08235 [archaeon]|nr:hypothetical protein [archaeon]